MCLLCSVQLTPCWWAKLFVLSLRLMVARKAGPNSSESDSKPAIAQLLRKVDYRLKHWQPLEELYGPIKISDEQWMIHEDLTQTLEADPENIDELKTRAVVRLQCGNSSHAYSDCKRIRHHVFAFPKQTEVIPSDYRGL